MAESREIGVTRGNVAGKYIKASGGTTVGASVTGAPSRLQGSFNEQIKQWASSIIEERIPAVVKETARRVFHRVLEYSPTDGPYTTGTFISYWKLSEGSPLANAATNDFRHAYTSIRSPISALHEKEAEIDAYFSGNRNTKNLNFFMTNSLPYARRVEHTGWGKRGPYAPVGKAMREAQNIVDKVVAEMLNGQINKYSRW